MGTLREVRRTLSAAATSAAYRAGPLMPEFAIAAMERALAGLGPFTPGVGSLVRANMKAAGVHTPEHVRDYFRNVARHLANGARIFGTRRPAETISRLAASEIEVDDSVPTIRTGQAGQPGVLIAPAHSGNFLVSLAALQRRIPLCIFLRWSKNARRLEMKRRWCQAAGIDVIVEPSRAGDPTARAAACIDALRAGKNVAITPDIAQKAAEGTPVSLLGRRAYLPSGPASLAMLAETELVPLFARQAEGRQVLYFESPIRVEMLPRSEGGRPEAVRRAMQAWCDGFERYLRACPPAWFLWADSRWTRVFRGDPKYGGATDAGDFRGKIYAGGAARQDGAA